MELPPIATRVRRKEGTYELRTFMPITAAQARRLVREYLSVPRNKRATKGFKIVLPIYVEQLPI